MRLSKRNKRNTWTKQNFENRKAGIGQEWIIAMAFVGVVVGAGLSSGQDILQYFLSFGLWGFAGILAMGALMAFFGKIVLSFGSYYRAQNHQHVLSKISTPLLSKAIDGVLIVTGFVIGFVMLAGAGSNLQQEFGLPSWLGALICTLLVIGAAFLNSEKITALLGIFTPIVIVLLAVITGWSLFNGFFDLAALDASAKTIAAPVDNLWLSTLNYFSMCLTSGLSMAIVLGGSSMKISTAEKGGRIGGFVVGLIMMLAFISLFLNINTVKDSSIPMLKIADQISPVSALVYTLTIFALIFNTAFSLFYSLAKRFGRGDEKKTRIMMVILCLAGYGCSFGGFSEMIGLLYPLVGWMGLVILGVLLVGWMKEKKNIQSEKKTRRSLLHLAGKWKDNQKSFSQKERQAFDRLCRQSSVNSRRIRQDVLEEVLQTS